MSDLSRFQHPRFARTYERLSVESDRRGTAAHRARALAGLEGRVVEVGAGNGRNFAHYPATVTEVIAVDPEARLRAMAAHAARYAPVPVRVVAGHAEALPVDAASRDAAVASLVLCSVPDPGRALAELRRVMRPGGELRFFEHVLAEDPRRARIQNAADRFWPWFGGGCHANRDTVSAIEGAGFEVEACDRFRFQPSPLLIPV